MAVLPAALWTLLFHFAPAPRPYRLLRCQPATTTSPAPRSLTMRAPAPSAASPRRRRVHHMGSPTPLLLFPSTSSIASNAAFLSALLPPLPSPPPCDPILYFQAPAAPNLVCKRPAPDVYLLPPPRHVTGDLFVFDVTAPSGGSAAVMLSLPVQGPAIQRRRQGHGVMLTLPPQSSEPVSSDDDDEAQRELVTPFCTSTHRVTAYFAVSSCHDICLYAPLPHASYPAASRLAKSRTTAALQTFSPFAKFSRFKAKQATQEAFEGQDLGDIHHITIMEGLQCPDLADILASRTRGPPRVRLTVLGASMEALEAMLARLVSSCHDICLYAPLPSASSLAAYRLANSRTTAAFQTSNTISRFAKFSHFKARQAIQDKEEFERQDLGHIHRIMILQGLQWPGLAHILASRTRGPPRVRLTVLGASMEPLHATGKKTSDFAKVRFYKFFPLEYTPGNLDSEKLDDSNTLCLIQRYKMNDQRETESEMKWALEKQDGGEEEERQKNKTICDLDDQGEYELPEVWLRKEEMEKHKNNEKANARLFTALKVTGIMNHRRFFLLLVLFCTLITVVDSSSRSGGSQQGFCPKPDVVPFLLPPHLTVCPVLDISSVHWKHSKRAAPAPQDSKQRTTTYICATYAVVFTLFCCSGPWISIKILEPIEGKVHKFLFCIRVKTVRMWYFTLAMSVNYYVSMIVYGVMSKSDQSSGIWVPNAIYCFIFLVLIGYLCYQEKRIFQNEAPVYTCICYIGGVGIIGLLHYLFVAVHPAKFEQTFYFEKIALASLVLMYLFRVFTMEHTPFNFIVNIVAALIPVFLLCTDEINKWHRYIVIGSSVCRTLECVLWVIWWILGQNPLIVIEL